ncbi:MAG: zinc metalloprotease, partial [Chitinophagaceae bacterium]
MDCKYFIYFLLYIICSLDSHGQVAGTNVAARCGTMERQQNRFNDDPALKAVFEQEQNQFNRIIKEGRNSISARSNRLNAIYTIPVVFHIVLGNPALVTDAQVKAQLDTLNKEFSGANPDTSKLPLFFRSLFGVSGINFCLAQRTPDGEVSSGIERVVTNNTSFSFVDDRVKHAGSGGAESWDAARYFNIWICVLDNNIAGYSTLPQDGIESDQGVVIDHRSLPGGSFTTYNRGKTLVHETGHYFNLYHTWGDDEGACTGSDFIDDTPNQADATTGCFSGIKTDKCTTSGNGIMYQNFMDYTDDACMILFTREQVARMETALTLYRSPLLISDGCQPVIKKNFDVQLVSIDQPGQRLCSPLFNPAISIKNRGTQTLSSFVITIS